MRLCLDFELLGYEYKIIYENFVLWILGGFVYKFGRFDFDGEFNIEWVVFEIVLLYGNNWEKVSEVGGY